MTEELDDDALWAACNAYEDTYDPMAFEAAIAAAIKAYLAAVKDGLSSEAYVRKSRDEWRG